jgi:hypothetical protein
MDDKPTHLVPPNGDQSASDLSFPRPASKTLPRT